MGERIGNAILEWITNQLINLVNFFMEFISNVLFNYDGLAGIALDAYNFFAWFAGIALVAVCLGKIFSQMVSEAEGSSEATIAHTIVSTVKAGFLVVIMPFAVTFAFNQIIRPISEYFLGLLEDNLIENIEQLAESEHFVEVTGGLIGTFVIWLFVLVVFAFFVIKMFIEQAQLLMDEILSPMVAISVVTDDFNMVGSWWKEILRHTVTIITLTLSIALFGEALLMDTETIWGQLPAIIGSGALVIMGPSLLKSLWYKSGAGSSGQNAARSGMHMISRQLQTRTLKK